LSYSAVSYVECKGANYSDKSVEIEENVITADGPESEELFAQKISDILMRKTV
jgi:hypothetical protein